MYNPLILPKFLTSDVQNKCIIYQLTDHLDNGSTTSCVYQAMKQVHYAKGDVVVEDIAKGTRDSVMFDVSNLHPMFPEQYGDQELIWYQNTTDIDEVVTLCVI